ncbi:TetR/AcrR family transcriptional regulator [Spirillospora sp. CA-255316]
MGIDAEGTRDRILDTAERLFGERGFTGTSLRAVTAAAQVNVASIYYHFESKEGLLRAVARRAMASVNEERRLLLDDLCAAGGVPGVEELVRAFVVTGADLVNRQGERGEHVARFIGRVMCEPGPEIRRLFADEVGHVEGRYLDSLAKALPDLPADEVAFRYRSMVGLVALHQIGALTDLAPSGPLGVPGTPQGDDAERLVAAITALFLGS